MVGHSSLRAGKFTVTAAINGSSMSIDTVFRPDEDHLDSSKSTLTATPVSILADGVDTSVITLTLKDVNANLVRGQTVTFSSNRSGVVFSSAVDNDDGTYSVNMSGTEEGNADVTAHINSSIQVTAANIVTLQPVPSTH